MNWLTDNVVVEAIRSIVGPTTLALLGFVIWRLQQTDKTAKQTQEVAHEVKAQVQNSHPDSLRHDLDRRFDNIDAWQRRNAEWQGKVDNRLTNLEDSNTVQEIRLGVVTGVLAATKKALDEGFSQSDSTDS